MTSEALPSPRTAGEPVFLALLHAGIPLSLLLDLLSPDGPQSQELYAQESRA